MMESVPLWSKGVKGGPSGPFARLDGHGILLRFSSPGGEGMKTHFFYITELTQRMRRLGGPLGSDRSEQLARRRLDGRHG
jgi:hypothetical protein